MTRQDDPELTPDNASSVVTQATHDLFERARALLGRAAYAADVSLALERARHEPMFLATRLQVPGGRRRYCFVGRYPGVHHFSEVGFTGAWTPMGRASLLLLNDVKDGYVRESYSPSSQSWAGESARTYHPAGGLVIPTFRARRTVMLAEPVLEGCEYFPLPPKVVEDELPEPSEPAARTELAAHGEETREKERRQPVGLLSRVPVWGTEFRDVIPHLDREQLDLITHDHPGALIITGPPGTGKTLVALYRIQFLFSVQEQALQQGDLSEPRYHQDRILFLVGRAHLVPYVRSIARRLGIGGIQIRTFRDWCNEVLLRHALFTGGHTHKRTVRPCPVPRELIPRLFPERSIVSFLQREITAYYARLGADLAAFARHAIDTVAGWMPSGWPQERRTKYLDAPAEVAEEDRWTGQTANGAIDVLQKWLARIHYLMIDDWRFKDFYANRPKLKSDERKKSFAALNDVLENISFRLKPDMHDIIRAFYRSDEARQHIEAAIGPDRAEEVQKWLADPDRPLDSIDHVVCGWAAIVASQACPSVKPLPVYDHIVLDEAQFYAPESIGFLLRLARRSSQPITLVGDPLQAWGRDRVLDHLEELLPEDLDRRVVALNRVYRSSFEIFTFLERLRSALSLPVTAQPPRTDDGFHGSTPVMRGFPSSTEEIRWIRDTIQGTRARHKRASIAVVHPLAGQRSRFCELVSRELRSAGITVVMNPEDPTTAAGSAVVLTSPRRMVGLEFDAVLLGDLADGWGEEANPDLARQLWTAATRARHILALTWSGKAPKWTTRLALANKEEGTTGAGHSG